MMGKNKLSDDIFNNEFRSLYEIQGSQEQDRTAEIVELCISPMRISINKVFNEDDVKMLPINGVDWTVENLLNDSLEKLIKDFRLRAAGKVQCPNNPKAWVHLIAKNVAKDFVDSIRAKNRYLENGKFKYSYSFVSKESDDYLEDVDNVDQLLSDRSRSVVAATTLEELLKKGGGLLSEVEKEVIKLTLDSVAVKDIAAQLEVTERTVLNYKKSGVAKLSTLTK